VPRWRRWVGLAVLVIGLGALVLHLIGREPVQVQVVYHYGRASEGLRRTVIRYQDGDDVLRRVAFSYATQPAGERQLHAARLPRGEYRVVVTLMYDDPTPPDVAGARRIEGSGRGAALRVERPLPVSGDGRLHIYVGAEEQGRGE
jgi:hypothetical protein